MVNYDIIIIGGGLNGLTLACILSERRFNVALVDKSDLSAKMKIRDGRAIAISSFSQKILEKYNLWDEISKLGAGEIHNILIKDRDSSHSMEFNNDLVDYQTLGFLVSSDEIARGLYKIAKASKYITILDKTECLSLDSEKSLVKLSSGKTMAGKLTVIADGKKSRGRDLLKLPVEDKSYDQVAFVFNIKHSLPHNNYAYEIFHRNGPFALLPLHSQYESGVVWADQPKTKSIINDDFSLFTQFLEQRCKDLCGKVEITSAVNTFPLSLSYMKEYYKGRNVFIGDSLHFIHPIAGQGYNLSIRDINVLVDLVVEYRDLGLDIGSKILLDIFTNQRKKDNMLMIRITDMLNSIFVSDSSLLSFGRKLGIDAIDNIPMLKKIMMQYAMGNKIDSAIYHKLCD